MHGDPKLKAQVGLEWASRLREGRFRLVQNKKKQNKMPGDPWPHSSRFNLYRSTQDSIQKPKSPQITPPSHIHPSPSVLSNHSSSSIFFNSISITSECFLFKRLLNPRSQGMKGFINPRVPRSIQITESLERCGPYWQASQTGECGFQA